MTAIQLGFPHFIVDRQSATSGLFAGSNGNLAVQAFALLQSVASNDITVSVQPVTGGRAEAFIAGRAAARSALCQLDAPVTELARDRCGRSIWPPGTVGAISHMPGVAIAVCARSRDFVGIGVDIEPRSPVAASLAAAISHPDDQCHAALTLESPADTALALLVAKEACLKADDAGYSMHLQNYPIWLFGCGGFVAGLPTARFAVGRVVTDRDLILGIAYRSAYAGSL